MSKEKELRKVIKKKYNNDNVIPQPKRFILERERATIVLKEKEIEPSRSLFFKDEFTKEQTIDRKWLF